MAQSSEAPEGAEVELLAEDRLAIIQLISEYNVHEDTGDADAWAALFTVDGTFLRSGKPPISGRDDLRAFARHRWQTDMTVRNRTHWFSNPLIKPSSMGALAETYQMTIDRNGEGYRIKGISGKSDDLRREDGKWRFYCRKIIPMLDG